MCFLYFCWNVCISNHVHSSFSWVAVWPMWADLRLWDLAVLHTLLCARYCMQGHHLAAASSGWAALELIRSLNLRQEQRQPWLLHIYLCIPTDANSMCGVKRLNDDSDLASATQLKWRYVILIYLILKRVPQCSKTENVFCHPGIIWVKFAV